MKDRIITLSMREIKNSIRRFISLIVMSLLGVGVFVGLYSSPKNMIESLDKYYDDNNYYDFKIISTLGLTDNDVNYLNNLEEVDSAYGLFSKDASFEEKDKTSIIKLYSINNNINNYILSSGDNPKNNDEIVVEEVFLKTTKLSIGDYITILNSDNLKTNKLKIVGTIKSPYYILKAGTSSTNRGNTSLGNGVINYFGYANEDLFDYEVYTDVYLKVTDAKKLVTDSKEYNDLIDKVSTKLDSIKSSREEARLQEIKDKYNKEIDAKENEGLTKLHEARDILDSSGRKLADAKRLLVSSKNTLDSTKRQLDNSLVQINNNRSILEENEKKLNEGKELLDSNKELINNELSKYGLDYEDILVIYDILNNKKVSLVELQNLVPDSYKYKDSLDELIKYLYDNYIYDDIVDYINMSKDYIISQIPSDFDNRDELIEFIKNGTILDLINDKNKTTLISYIPTDLPNYKLIVELVEKDTNKLLEIKELFDGALKIKNGYIDYNNGIISINNYKKQLDDGYNNYLNYINQYNSGLEKYNKGLREYNDGLSLYNSGLEEYLRNKRLFEEEIAKARSDVNNLEKPTWYISSRLDDSEYSGYINTTNSIRNLSVVFPTIFFAVAVFMSIMCMNRMALEARGEIGTLKSLGFSNKDIRKKYLIYSLLASMIGGLLGVILGGTYLPYFVFNIYKILYDIPVYKPVFEVVSSIFGIFISVFLIVASSIITVHLVVNEGPASLMRPKSPKVGKKMLIERFPFWNKMLFSNKVTIRNIVRYRKRFIMTILGIAGCTILVLSGFGIKDAIIGIPDKQFKEVFHYNSMVYVDNISKERANEIFDLKEIENRLDAKMATATSGIYSINLFVPSSDSKIDDVLSLKDNKKALSIEDNKIIISHKLSELTNTKVGDNFIFVIDNKEYSFVVNGIAENYVANYIFMNQKTYEDNFEEFKINVSLINYKESDSINEKLLSNKEVLGLNPMSITLKEISNMLSSLDSVVLILIVLSGLLSFSVLYNLSYINISERKREISTLKVLGFFPREVDNYIIKEMIIITIIGILIGLFFGIFVTYVIVDLIEMDLVEFIHEIRPISFLGTFVIMIIFNIIVSFIIHFSLKKIDMIESLKSVE